MNAKSFLDNVRRLSKIQLAKNSKFFLHYLNLKPKYARFKVTGGCNLRCESCKHWKMDSHKSPELGEIEELSKKLEREGFTHIGLTGGEPGIRNDLSEVVKTFNDRGFSIGMTTNGSLINEKRLRKLFKKGLDSINISIDGPKEIHNSISRKDVYEDAMECLKSAAQISEEEDFHVTSGAVLSKTTMANLLESIKEKMEFGVPTTIQPIMSSAYFLEDENIWIEDTEKVDKFVEKIINYKKENPKAITNPIYSLNHLKKYFRNPRVPSVPCTFGHMAVCVDSNLNLYSCWSLPPLGNLKEEDLDNILHSRKFEARQIDMFHKKCSGCSCGYIVRLGTVNLRNAWSLFISKVYKSQF